MNTKRFLTLSVMATILVASCAKETNPAAQETIKPDTPAQEQGSAVVNPDGTISLTFASEATSKTSLRDDGKTVDWVQNDAIRFYGEDDFSDDATAKTAGHSTEFTNITVPGDLDALYVTYPAGIASGYEDGTLSIVFPGTLDVSDDDGEFANMDFSVAQAVKTDGVWNTSLTFKNVASLLQISVTDDEINQISIQGLNNEPMSGTLPVSFNASGELVFGTATSTSNKVNLNIDGAGEYFIPVLPGTVSEGFRVTLYKDATPINPPFTYLSSFTLAAGQITKLTAVDEHNGQFYVKPDGAGNKSGVNWNNAMDAATFKAFVENQDNFFLLKGSTFHFSAEEFSFGDDYVKPSYPDHGNVNFTIEGTITPTDTTTFLGRTNTTDTGNNVKAGVLWPQNNSYLTVKNVKFTGTNGASNASVIRINSSAKEVNLDHCYFRNNSTAGNGGAISLFNSATLNITNCSFSNGTCAGGIVHVNHASAVVNITDSEAKYFTKNAIYAENCASLTATRVTFRDNNDAGEYGAAAYVTGSGGTVTFNDCDFIRNHSTVQGGAICVNGTSVTTTFIDCDFIDNWSDKKGGAVMIESGNANTTFTGGKFQGNHANGADNTHAAGAAIYATGSGVKVSCTDVLFKENYNYIGTNAYSGGILRIQQEGGEGYFNGCVFDGNWTNRENSKINSPCAAIVNCRVGDVKYYFNACEFKENTSGVSNDAGRCGGLRGTVFATLAGCTFAFNNCSFHDNYGGRNSDDISWIGMDNTSSTLILANTTIAGDNYRAPETGAGRKNNWGVIKFQNTGNYYFLNSIVCSLDPVGNSFWVNGDISVDGGATIGNGGTKLPVYCWYSKISKEGDNRTAWTEDTGSGHDYYATNASFGSWTMPYTWNGTLTGTNSNMLAATADVNTQIQNADADFYAWLNSIGALGKDINGNNRGATSWPGCYQN